MISAVEALALPKATVSDSDLFAAAAIVTELDAHVRQHMTPAGVVVMEIDPARLNPIITSEVGHELRRRGWVAQFQERRERSSFMGGQEVTMGFQIAIAPTDAARDEFAAKRQAARVNGVASGVGVLVENR